MLLNSVWCHDTSYECQDAIANNRYVITLGEQLFQSLQHKSREEWERVREREKVKIDTGLDTYLFFLSFLYTSYWVESWNAFGAKCWLRQEKKKVWYVRKFFFVIFDIEKSCRVGSYAEEKENHGRRLFHRLENKTKKRSIKWKRTHLIETVQFFFLYSIIWIMTIFIKSV